MMPKDMKLADAALRLGVPYATALRWGLTQRLDLRRAPDGRSWLVSRASVERRIRELRARNTDQLATA
jgi:predicted site-specific integrase-resolvase